MSDDGLRMEVYDFLYRHFPGSTLDDGYYFVRIQAPAVGRVRRDKVLDVFEKLVEAPAWLVTVNNDPSDSIDAIRIEQRTTGYNPDWNYCEDMPQWFAQLPVRPRVDLEALRTRMNLIGALALISPTHCLVFDIRYMRVHAASKDDLDRFVRGNEECFEQEHG